jgi:cell division protein FtsI (penicillin-binding protein 3)
MRDYKQVKVSASASPDRWIRARVVVMGGVFVALLVCVFARATQLQVQETAKLKGLAEDQYVRAIEIPARRGDVVDRRGVPLAQSVEVDSIWVDPSLVPDPKAASKALGKALALDSRELFDRLIRAKRFAWVARQVTPQDVLKVKALGLPGLGFTKEPRRFYPQKELAGHVLGVVGTDSKGLDGLELAFDDELSGGAVRRSAVRDAKGRKLFTSGVEADDERAGAAITLTLDRHLQYVTEKALQKAVEDAKAVAGIAVAMDPSTGEVLALANAPRFNPNAPQGASKDTLRNRAVTDSFEPGSTFKAFVVAGALDAKVVREDSTFDCENGTALFGRSRIRDTHPHATLTVRGVLQVSSNICSAKIGQKLGREGLVETYRRFGFAEKPGLGLPGEIRGVVPYPKAEVALATESFGQGLTASAVQVVAGYAALANGGLLMKPFVVAKVVDPDGVVLLENRPTVVRRAASEGAAKAVVSMLESVVEHGGTAPKARMDEYRVSGKTGTAQKADPVTRGYSADKRLASFVGMVPAEKPRIVIGIFIDEPKTDVYGGLVAAPAFKEIASQAMPHLAVPPSRMAPPVAQQKVDSPKKVAEPEKSLVVAAIERLDEIEDVTPGATRVPNLLGQPGRAAISQLLGAALEPRVNGSGRVTAQSPAAGSVVEKGARVTLELASNSQ